MPIKKYDQATFREFLLTEGVSVLVSCLENVPTEPEKVSLDEMCKNATEDHLDLFAAVTNAYLTEQSLLTWYNRNEAIRVQEKSVGNKIGEFHQRLLGRAPGVLDLGVGHPTKLDLLSEPRGWIAEVKNRFNTHNANSAAEIVRHLDAAVKVRALRCGYWVRIIERSPKKKEFLTHQRTVYDGKSGRSLIYVVSGDVAYSECFGFEEAFKVLTFTYPEMLKLAMQKIRPHESRPTLDLSHVRKLYSAMFER